MHFHVIAGLAPGSRFRESRGNLNRYHMTFTISAVVISTGVPGGRSGEIYSKTYSSVRLMLSAAVKMGKIFSRKSTKSDGSAEQK
jgi:hypothetical protein